MKMKITIEEKKIRIKRHLEEHKVVYTVAVCAVVAYAAQRQSFKHFNQFMIEKDIDPMEYHLRNHK